MPDGDCLKLHLHTMDRESVKQSLATHGSILSWDEDDLAEPDLHDRLRAEQLTKVRHVGLQRVVDGLGRVLTPDHLAKVIDRNGVADSDHQCSEQRSRVPTADRDTSRGSQHIDRPQHPNHVVVLHGGSISLHLPASRMRAPCPVTEVPQRCAVTRDDNEIEDRRSETAEIRERRNHEGRER